MTEFEKVSNDEINFTDSGDLRENAIYWTNGDENCTVNFTQVKYITKVKKLAEKFPDDVKIKSEKNGVLIATLPVKAVKLNIVERELTDEERELMAERIRNSIHAHKESAN